MKLYYTVLLMLFSCGAGMSDHIEDMGNGLYYLFEGGELNKIYFSANNKRTIEKIVISSGVQKINFNDEFIILKRIISKDKILDSINNNLSNTFSYVNLLKKTK